MRIFINSERRLTHFVTLFNRSVPTGGLDAERKKETMEETQKKEEQMVKSQTQVELHGLALKTIGEREQAFLAEVRTALTNLSVQPPQMGSGNNQEFTQALLLYENRQKSERQRLDKLTDALASLGAPALPFLLAQCQESVERSHEAGFRVFAEAVARIHRVNPGAAATVDRQSRRMFIAVTGFDPLRSADARGPEIASDTLSPQMQWALASYVLEHPDADVGMMIRNLQSARRTLTVPGTSEEIARRCRQVSVMLRDELEPQTNLSDIRRLLPMVRVLANALQGQPRNDAQVQSALKIVNESLAALRLPREKQKHIAQYLLVAPFHTPEDGGRMTLRGSETVLLDVLTDQNLVAVLRDVPQSGIQIVLEQGVTRDGHPQLAETLLLSIIGQGNPVLAQRTLQFIGGPTIGVAPNAGPSAVVPAVVQPVREQIKAEAAVEAVARTVILSLTATSQSVIQAAEILSRSLAGIETLSSILSSENSETTRRLEIVEGMRLFWERQQQGTETMSVNINDLMSATKPALQRSLVDPAPAMQAASLNILTQMVLIAGGSGTLGGIAGTAEELPIENIPIFVRGVIHPEDYRNPLRYLLSSSPDESVRLRVVELIGVLGNRSDARLLIDRVGSQSLATAERATAARALVRLCSNTLEFGDAALLPQMIDGLLDLYADTQNGTDGSHRQTMQRALLRLRHTLVRQRADRQAGSVVPGEPPMPTREVQELTAWIARITAVVGA